MKRSVVLTLACLVALAEWPHVAHAAQSSVIAEDHMIESGDPGIRLFVRNKHPAGLTQYRAEKTVLYVHGSSQAASSTFDLKIAQESWMDYIVARGYDAYLVDLRGYGRSTRPPEFAKPADENPPVVRTDVAMRDVAAAVDFILQRPRVKALDLIGWSWGTALMGRYANEHKERVHRLVLYAPMWLHEPASTPTQLGAYRTWTIDCRAERSADGAPEAKKDELLSPEVFGAWSAAEVATDPEGAKQSPPVVRTPNGSYADDQDHRRPVSRFGNPRKSLHLHWS